MIDWGNDTIFLITINISAPRPHFTRRAPQMDQKRIPKSDPAGVQKWTKMGAQKGPERGPRQATPKHQNPLVSLCFGSNRAPGTSSKRAQNGSQNEPQTHLKWGPKRAPKGPQNYPGARSAPGKFWGYLVGKISIDAMACISFFLAEARID